MRLVPRHGAIALPGGEVQFSLWAPGQQEVSVAFEDGDTLPMERSPDGWFTATARNAVGKSYRFQLPDGTRVPDPASRRQTGGVHGASVVVDHASYQWRDGNWRGLPWRESIIYEVHAGALGGFRGLIDRLANLVSLGVTALELMPVNEFPGAHNWGYDGVLPYAPAEAYGSPDDLKSLVDAAHAHGLMVYLDVVYNHFGPDGNYLGLYAPQFFRTDIHTPWGAAIDFRQPAVRSFFTENVLMWLRDYHIDGLRFDAVHAITEQDWVDEMAAAVRAEFPPERPIHLMLEHHNQSGPLSRNVDAQWNDDLHNVMHVLLTGETEGYYADYAENTTEKLARCLKEGWVYQGEYSAFLKGPRGTSAAGLPPTAHIFFLQNHDQIGNRALGERLTLLADPATLEAAIALQLLSPQIPLLFMGEEEASRTAFLFFTDHNPELAEAVRNGRRAEFAGFAQFASPEGREKIPDPNSKETFKASIPKPDPAQGAARLALYRRLLTIRKTRIAPHLDGARSIGSEVLGPKAVVARWRLGNGSVLTIGCNLGENDVTWQKPSGELLFSSADATSTSIPPRFTAAYLG